MATSRYWPSLARLGWGLTDYCTVLAAMGAGGGGIGVLGMLAGLSTLAARRLLAIAPQPASLEALNGILVGLYLGGLHPLSWQLVAMTILAGPLTILVGACLTDWLVLRNRLPLLSATFMVVGVALFEPADREPT